MGNLRTALVAWAWARTTGRRFLLRNEDLDAHRKGAAEQQVQELKALGIGWDGPILDQSDRFDIYRRILDELADADMLFECYCSRKDIAEASRAPHSPPGHYPGTCSGLDPTQRQQERERLSELGRKPALRLRAPEGPQTVTDMLHNTFTGPVDSFVLRRGDGTPSYNLAVVVDDALTGVDQVVRGGDLLFAAPGQAHLARALGFSEPIYGHVPLVLGPTGKRLAKRDGAVTLEDLAEHGWSRDRLLREMTGSLGTKPVSSAQEFLGVFDPNLIPKVEYAFTAENGFEPATG